MVHVDFVVILFVQLLNQSQFATGRKKEDHAGPGSLDIFTTSALKDVRSFIMVDVAVTRTISRNLRSAGAFVSVSL